MDSDVAQKVQRAKLELEQMIDLNPQVMMLVNGEGVITRANMACVRLVGAEGFDRVLGRPVEAFFAFPSGESFMSMLGEKSGYEAREVEVALPGERRRWMAFTVVGLGSHAASYAVMVEDVSERKKLAAMSETEHKKQAVQALLGALMHNINQPLTVISVRARLLQSALAEDPVDREELKKGLQNIVDLSLEIAKVLSDAEAKRDYVTETYLAGIEILNLKQDAGKGRAPDAEAASRDGE